MELLLLKSLLAAMLSFSLMIFLLSFIEYIHITYEAAFSHAMLPPRLLMLPCLFFETLEVIIIGAAMLFNTGWLGGGFSL